jgi:UDP:flavonoid glycosyltransferase YjiC (YdhE family)
MRVLMSAVLQPSHFYPLVPLAWALRAAGHEVQVAHQPCLTPVVRTAGLTSVEVGSDMTVAPENREKAKAARARMTSSVRPTPEQQMRHTRITLGVFAQTADGMIDSLVDYAQTWKPDLIVFEWLSYAAHLTGQILDIPTVRHQFPGPDYATGDGGWRDAEREFLGDLYRRHGVAEVEPDGLVTIDPCPPCIQFDLTGQRRQYLPVRYVAYNGAGQAEQWIYKTSGKPRVLLTFGGTYLWLMGDLAPIRGFVDALAELDIEVVVAVPAGGTALVGAVGANVRVVENVPLELLLPTCDAVISHGGTGTFATALVHGVPQIVSPPSSMGEPPFHSAERIVKAGAGVQVDIHLDSPEHIRDEVSKVIGDPSYRAAARLLADEVRSLPLPIDLVAELERVALGAAP